MEIVVGVLLRWLHVVSVTILLGGIFYARFAAGGLAPRFRPWMWGTTAALLGSGLYNLLTKSDLPPTYHMVFGVKMLLVLHIFVVGLVLTVKPGDDPKTPRLMTGVVWSGLAVLALSAYLRWISLS